MENPPFWWYLPGKMGIFMGYVSFREGSWNRISSPAQLISGSWTTGTLVPSHCYSGHRVFFWETTPVFLHDQMARWYTPPKFNMEPKNQTLEKEIPFGNHHFQVPCLTLGVYRSMHHNFGYRYHLSPRSFVVFLRTCLAKNEASSKAPFCIHVSSLMTNDHQDCLY